MHKHCNNVSGIIIHPLKQIFPSPFCTHWQKVPLYITKVGCSVQMLNKVMFWASSFFLSSSFQAWGCAGVCWVQAVGWGQSCSAWSAVSFSLQCMPSCKYLQSILWEAWVFTAKACGSTLRVCMYMSNEDALLLSVLSLCVCLSDEALPLVSPQSANTSTWLSFRPPALSSVCESTFWAKSWRGGRSSLWIFCKRQKDGRCVCAPRLILYTRLQHWHHVFAAGTFS